MKKHYRTEHNCLNCGNTFEGKFCNNCGQENLELHEDFGHVMAHAVGDYFHFDEKFFHTLRPLLFSPGKLTVDYMAGKRTQYLHPIRMYIFISLVYFILLFSNTNRQNEIEQRQVTTGHAIGKDKASVGVATFTFTNKGDTTYQQYLQLQQKLPADKRDNIFDRYITKKFYDWKARGLTPDEAIRESFQHNFPKAMFFLLPLFALFLKIAFRKNHKYYVEHLIYAFHLHCFIFLFSTIIILLEIILPDAFGKSLRDLSFLVVLYYVYRSLRVIYQRSAWRTITKMIGVYSMYFASFIIVVIVLLGITAVMS